MSNWSSNIVSNVTRELAECHSYADECYRRSKIFEVFDILTQIVTISIGGIIAIMSDVKIYSQIVMGLSIGICIINSLQTAVNWSKRATLNDSSYWDLLELANKINEELAKAPEDRQTGIDFLSLVSTKKINILRGIGYTNIKFDMVNENNSPLTGKSTAIGNNSPLSPDATVVPPPVVPPPVVNHIASTDNKENDGETKESSEVDITNTFEHIITFFRHDDSKT
jgi:hypothetical protein